MIVDRLIVLEDRAKSIMTDKPYELEPKQLILLEEEVKNLRENATDYSNTLPKMTNAAVEKADKVLHFIESYEREISEKTQEMYENLMRKVKIASYVPAINPGRRAEKFRKYREQWKMAEEVREILTGSNPYFDSGLTMGLAEIEYKSRRAAETSSRKIRKMKRMALAGIVAAGLYFGAGLMKDGAVAAYEGVTNYFTTPSTKTEQVVEKESNKNEEDIEKRIMEELKKHEGFKRKDYKEMQIVASVVYKMMQDPEYKAQNDKKITDKIKEQALSVYQTLAQYVGE
ncbi:hypothetical protein D6764_01040 [Candidatus Woesearchaeota archaeon]|nr:MAG: hypothetical protein D6764_01040 [Candidatus Woesearchaeota archaeon]